jgi:hypothetical protein
MSNVRFHVSHHVPETAIDYDAVYRRGGHNCGDEDFALFKCPACKRVYLLEYEVDTVYLDGKDLSKRQNIISTSEPFVCVGCKEAVPNGCWIGRNAEDRFLVTWEELKRSDWHWIAKPMAAFGDET